MEVARARRVTLALVALAGAAGFAAANLILPSHPTQEPVRGAVSARNDGSAMVSSDARLDPPTAAPSREPEAFFITRADGDERRAASMKSTLHRAIETFYLELLEARGRTVSACDADGLIDDTIIRVRFRVVTDERSLTLGDARSADSDLPPAVRECIDGYLDHRVTVTTSGPALGHSDFDVIDMIPTGDVRPANAL